MKQLSVYHLLDDQSGSPRVLATVLEGLLSRGVSLELTTSRGGPLGRLAEARGVRLHTFAYTFAGRPLVTMLRYLRAQMVTFADALRHIAGARRIYYINTLLPVGPALAARLTGHKVVCHYHENADVKGRVYRLLSAMMMRLAHRVICVSAYQASLLPRQRGVTVIPNAVPPALSAAMRPDAGRAFAARTVLMLASLKAYKGTDTLVRLARMLPDVSFVLVLNETLEAVNAAYPPAQLPANLAVHPRTDRVEEYYNRASVVVNLSDPRLFVETFGLTALEAMTAGLPVIVPPVGGIAEMVSDGHNGWRIDPADTAQIASRISQMLADRDLYGRLSQVALDTAARYSAERQVEAIMKILSDL